MMLLDVCSYLSTQLRVDIQGRRRYAHRQDPLRIVRIVSTVARSHLLIRSAKVRMNTNGCGN
jgi:hypothetical protein